jgi:hypothetical protein
VGEMPIPSPELPKPKPMTEAQVSAWKRRLTASVDPIKRIITQGKVHTQRYQGKTLSSTPGADTVVVPLDYSYTEQKKAQVFFQVPELHLEALRPDSEAAAPLAQAVINQCLGPYGVHAKAMMFETLADVLCSTGYGVTVIGYTPTQDGTEPIVVGQRPVPVSQPGAVLGLQPAVTMEPIIEAKPKIIAESYHWDRIPPGFLRVPAEFRGSDFDKAPWLAYRFADDVKDEKDARGSSRSDDDEMLLSEIPTDQRATKRWGTRVWYKAARFDTDAKHPDLIRTFVLYDDENEARDRKNSPYQRIAPDGSLFGMVGYPVHVLTLRYVSDAWAPPSDVQMSRQQVDELSKGRTQMIQRRDRALPQVGYDGTRVTPETLAKLERGDNSAFVGFNGPVGDAFTAINKGTFGRENFEFDSVIKSDVDQAWALGSNAGVIRTEGGETATKSSQIQAAVDTRLEAERTRVLEFFVTGAMKLFALKQLFATTEDYVRVIGQDGVARLTPWTNAQIAGQFAFKAKPDSHIRIDAQADREMKIRAYNLLRQDPMINPQELIAPVAEFLGLDMARLMKQPEPPKSEPPKLAVSFNGVDLDPNMPQSPIVLDLLKQQGVQIDLGAIQAAMQLGQQALLRQAQAGPGSTEHGGAAEKTNPIDQHDADLTGQQPGPRPM